jgi:hypothetical protein
MGFGEDRSSGLWLTVIQAPWVACWQCPVDHEVGQHLALDRMERHEIQLKLN